MKSTEKMFLQKSQTRAVPQWIKSYHLLIFAFAVMVCFGAVLRFSEELFQ